MRVRYLMTTDVITIGPQASLKEAARRMLEAGVSGLPVTDGEGRLVGIVTEADFLATESERGNKSRTSRMLRLFTGEAEPFARERKVGDVMTTDLVTVGPDADHSEAARIMEKTKVKRLPVVDGSKLRGLVSRADILRAFARADQDIIEEITEKVMGQTLWIDPELVEVKSEDGNVRLSGRLEARTEAQLLVELTKRVDGVASVFDDLSWNHDDTRQSRLAPPIAGFPPDAM
ncbi:MAG: CBS domain-containing protein [Actinobacteria bacterium]|nr:CBS domain-containing protein [Actinomycetota bacterium]